jgi:hypothetical protein
MPNRLFLETYPLYRKLKTSVGYNLAAISKPAIKMYCPVCKSDQTFAMANKYFDSEQEAERLSPGCMLKPTYICMSCRRFLRDFLVQVGPQGDWIMKAGQYPPWEVEVDEPLRSALGNRAELMSKGLISESQGYGIGAFAYYRRIVEEIIDDLLSDIGSMLSGEDAVAYGKALGEAKVTKITQDKIMLVKDLLPPILRPDDMNPLSALHEALSEGLHAQSDEECLEIAGHVREILSFLVVQVANSKRSSKTFTESMRKILDRKTGPKA